MTQSLTCPVCAAPMAESQREDITIDTCTRFRGVWLDRGELDKMLAIWRGGEGPSRPPVRQGESHARHDDHDDDHYRSRGHKRSRMDSIFDIFD